MVSAVRRASAAARIADIRTPNAAQIESRTVTVTGDSGPSSAKRRITRDFDIPVFSERTRRETPCRDISSRSESITARSKA
nr:MAG TPA: hypothetical protein [Caudoviricetes sp.]